MVTAVSVIKVAAPRFGSGDGPAGAEYLIEK
jgi:hypothetical protein